MTTTAVKSAVRTRGDNANAEPGCMASRCVSADQPVMLQKRIGATTYVVSVRFSQTSRETMQDKVLRLIESEVQKIT